MFLTRLRIATGLLFVLGAAAAADPAAKADKDLIQGTWVLVAGRQNGQNVPDDEIKRGRAGGRLVITADKFTFKGSAGGGDRVSVYKLDPTRKPKVIEVTPQDGPAKGQKSLGLYRLDGDTLKLCVNNRGVQKEAPQDFTAEAGTGLTVLTFQREKEPKEKGK